jgi:predicted nuclease with TOPRIM domain
MSSEVIARLVTEFNNLNEKCVNLIEENQNLKQENQNLKQENQNLKQQNQNFQQQNQNLQQENQILKEKLREKDKQLEKLQERDKQYEKLEQHVKNLEKQKSEELQQLRQLEIISQNLQNNLGILGLDKTKKNDVRITEENNNFLTNKNDEQKIHNIDKPTSNNKDDDGCSSNSFNKST